MGIHRHAVTFATCYRLHSCNMQLVLSGTVPRCCAWANTGNSLGKDSKAGAAGTSPAFYSLRLRFVKGLVRWSVLLDSRTGLAPGAR